MFDINMLRCLMEIEKNGIIFLDHEGKVKEINTKAKHLFGIIPDEEVTHPEGEIKDGDIVIICDSQIGEDDGKLIPKDLACLGIDEPRLKMDDSIVAIGMFNTKKHKCKYRFSGNSRAIGKISIDDTVLGHKFSAEIDFNDRNAIIIIDGKEYKLSFITSIGHIVVVDGETFEPKFIQNKGYTIKHEGIKDILSGKRFQAKVSDSEIEVIGKNFMDIFSMTNNTFTIDEILSGKKDKIINSVCDVNKSKIVISAYAVKDQQESVIGAVLLISALDNITSLFNERDRILDTVENQRKMLFNREQKIDEAAFENIIGYSSALRAAKHMAYKASNRKDTVIITGESGTGKSLMAKEIYKAGGSVGPFIAVDCTTIPTNLFESEMFGYVGGAFTGANSKGKVGFFEEANGGTIFLDEIGEIPLSIQAKLLSAIQNKEIYRVGSTKAIPVDVRIIAATNRVLEEEVEKGNFRSDLYYRINVFDIMLPPLRNCKEDLIYLAQMFLDKTCKDNQIDKKYLSNEAITAIVNYDWPGNIRELENIIKRAVLLCDDDVIYKEDIKIPTELHCQTLKEQIKNFERKVIIDTISRFDGDKKLAMKELEMSKSVFYAKLKEYSIEI